MISCGFILSESGLFKIPAFIKNSLIPRLKKPAIAHNSTNGMFLLHDKYSPNSIFEISVVFIKSSISLSLLFSNLCMQSTMASLIAIILLKIKSHKSDTGNKIMKTILSIEDNLFTQKDIKNAMTKEFNFVSIKDNFESITVSDIKKFNPDLILLDIQLCGINDKTGIEIAKKIRQGKMPVPIIMFSLRSEYSDTLLKDGLCNSFVQKPCDIEQILAEIEDFLF